MNQFLELLLNSDLIRNGEVNDEKIRRSAVKDLRDLAFQSVDISSANNLRIEDNAFSHTASLALAGSAQPCMMMECRVKRAREVGEFAALFSDRVFIHNILSERRSDTSERFKENLKNDLKIICTVLPLIESGRIVPISAHSNQICLHCAAREAIGIKDAKRFTRALKALIKRFQTETKMSLQRKDDLFWASLGGSEELLEHGSSAFLFSEIPKIFDGLPKIRAALEKGNDVAASDNVRKMLGIENRFAHSIFNAVAFELITSQYLKTSLLTESPLEVEILRNLSPKGIQIKESEGILQKHLTCFIPFLNELPIEVLLQLRSDEGDSLNMFRAALLKSIDEQKQKKGTFTEVEARSLYRDILEPELSRLNSKISAARKSARSKIVHSGIGWVAAFSVGIWSGFLNASILEAARAIGLTKILADTTTSMLSLSQQTETIESDPMYFLWKAKSLAR